MLVPCLDENTVLQYLEGLLEPSAVDEVDAHIAQCDECRWLLSASARETSGDQTAPTQLARPTPAAPRRSVDSRIGRNLRDTYVIEAFVGRGGMGTVYEASHKSLPRRFAVKFLNVEHGTDRKAIARIEREAKVTSQLRHPHIVHVTDFGHDESRPYLVMERLEGESLAERMAHQGETFELAEVALIAQQACSALQASHQHGVVHRDLKPSNVFLCKEPAGVFIKVMDFGISKVLGSQTQLTADAAVMGSPRYMAPEQARGDSAQVDGRADIFALGAILYELLAGVPAFRGESVPETLYKVLNEPPAETKRWRALPSRLRNAVLHALEKDRAARPHSMEAFWQELEEAFATATRGVDEAASPPGPAKAPRGWVPAAAALAALVVGLLVALVWFSRSASERPVHVAADLSRDAQRVARPPTQQQDAMASPSATRRVSSASKRRVVRKSIAPRYGSLTVQSKSRADGRHIWADVLLDGKRVGRTALTLDKVRAGPHLVEVRRAGFLPDRQRVVVKAGERALVSAALRRAH